MHDSICLDAPMHDSAGLDAPMHDSTCLDAPKHALDSPLYASFGARYASSSLDVARYASASQDDERYCRRCDRMLPLASFMRGQKRFCCRKHFYEMQRATRRTPRHRKRGEEISPEMRAIQYARKLARNTFSGYDLTVTVEDARNAIKNARCIVPRDPEAPLTSSNFALCLPAQRLVLSKLWSIQRDATVYKQILRTFQ
jgi:hypothetical protein